LVAEVAPLAKEADEGAVEEEAEDEDMWGKEGRIARSTPTLPPPATRGSSSDTLANELECEEDGARVVNIDCCHAGEEVDWGCIDQYCEAPSLSCCCE
jgi:hypothetical protein